MSVYSAMARWYDELTTDVPYDKFADFICKLFERHGDSPRSVLDLACGTGSISIRLAQRGYDVIGVDLSSDMLSRAAEKCGGLWNKPMFLCQSMTSLNLYGTVDAVICCLDSVNYLASREALDKAFKRVSLFLNPGGIFIFDLNTEYKLKRIARQSFVRETDNVYCAWQADYSDKTHTASFEIDLFEKRPDGLYSRSTESHRERAHTPDDIQDALERNGMTLERVYGELKLRAPTKSEERIFVVARRDGVPPASGTEVPEK